MRTCVVAAGIAAAVLSAGCGSGSRASVASYIDDVNAIQTQLRTPLLAAAGAYHGFSSRTSLVRIEPELAHARRTILSLDHRLRTLDPPPDARRLHRRLLRLVDAEGALAGEVDAVATFLPRLDNALRGLAPAHRRFGRALASARTGHAQAAALETYAGEVAGALERLRPLRAPPVLAPADRAEVRTLTRVQTSATALAEGLRRHRTAALPRLVRRFELASSGGTSLTVQRGQIAAIRSYNRRVAHVTALAAAVERERARLQRTLD